jgi:hypothetical protein
VDQIGTLPLGDPLIQPLFLRTALVWARSKRSVVPQLASIMSRSRRALSIAAGRPSHSVSLLK